jgi:succinate dehydrogenase/fumarate reductase flavoprotein subunit
VVVGAGGAGLSAAVEAASHGDLQIIVLEKQGVLGGNTNYSTGGINAAGTEAQQVLGINDSPELFFHPAGYRDLDGVKEELKQRAMQAASRFMQELYQKANITDNRYLFF